MKKTKNRFTRISKEEEARLQAQEEQQKNEELIAKAHELGLGFQEQDMPVEDFDESKIKRTNFHSVLALVPFTKEWYEGQEAEDALDNLPKIEFEKAKATALLKMSSIGEHERALAIMRAETKNDFYYFNKLKFKLENEGQYQYDPPAQKQKKRDHKLRNRFTKAIDMTFINFDEYLLASSQIVSKNSQCLWRGFTQEGIEMRCSNRKLKHPTRLVQNGLGMLVPDTLSFCHFHSLECVGDHPDRRKIVAPNQLSLCMECYYTLKQRRPKRVTFMTVPGVYLHDNRPVKQLRPTILTLDAVLSKDSLCRWKPNSGEKDTHRYFCENNVLRDVYTKEFLPVCGYHVQRCPRVHVRHRDSVINMPNELGLCAEHYKAEAGDFPPEVVFPYPGMRRNKVRGFERCRTSHWAAPPWLPADDLILCDNDDEEDDQDYQHENSSNSSLLRSGKELIAGRLSLNSAVSLSQKILSRKSKSRKSRKSRKTNMPKRAHESSNIFASALNLPLVQLMIKRLLRGFMTPQQLLLNKLGGGGGGSVKKGRLSLSTFLLPVWSPERAAVTIQKSWRRYQVLHIHREVQYANWMVDRLRACVLIQAIMRSIVTRILLARRIRSTLREAIAIQRRVRAFLARKLVQRMRAVLVLQRFCRNVRRMLMWECLQIVINLRIDFRKASKPMIAVQEESFHGLELRKDQFFSHVEYIAYQKSKPILFRFLQRLLRIRHNKKKRRDDILIRRMLSKRLARLIYAAYSSYRIDHAVALLVGAAVPQMQRVVRGYLGRMFAGRFRDLRLGLRQWASPVYAMHFYRQVVSGQVRRALLSQLPSFRISQQSSMTSSIHSSRTRRDYSAASSIDTCTDLEQFCTDGPRTLNFRSLIPPRFAQLDEIDWRVFLGVLDQFYRLRGSPLLASEATCLVKRFQNPENNRVNVVAVGDYISLHTEACRKHGRTVCGKCTFYRECRRAQCGCTHFIPAREGEQHGVCLTCGHATTNHRLCPKHLDVHEPDSMLYLLNYPRRPDLSMPMDISGVRYTTRAESLSTVLYGQDADKGTSAPRVETLTTTNCTPAEHGFDNGHTIEDKYSAVHFMESEGGEVDIAGALYDGGYWNDYHQSVSEEDMLQLKNHNNANTNNKSHSINASIISLSDRPPQTKIGKVQFWSTLMRKNPNKSRKQYFESFNQNIPLPVVHHNELRYTFDGYKIYIRLVIELSRMDPIYIQQDNPQLLRLIMDNIIIFEVHWRKMIVDIRVGTLNRRLDIDTKLKRKYERQLQPNEVNAEQLDGTLRELGFHKKVIGKDVVSIQFAAKKEMTSVGAAASAEGSVIETVDALKDTDELLDGVAVNDMVHYAGQEVSASSLLPAHLPLLSTLQSISLLSVNSDHHEVDTEENVGAYHSPIKMECGKYICPYPGCGRSFNSNMTALTHIFDHEKKVATVTIPLPKEDAFYEAFWPKERPWVPKGLAELDERLIPPTALLCPVKGCREYFLNERKLNAHLSRVHDGYEGHLKYKGDYFELDHIIPHPTVSTYEALGLYICKQHIERPFKKCKVCQEIEGKNFPKPPYKFFDTLSVNFPSNGDSDLVSGERYIEYIRSEANKGMKVIDKSTKGNTRVWVGLCKEFLLDRHNKCWLYMQELMNVEEAKRRKVLVSRDFDAEYEVYPCEYPFVWVPLEHAAQDVYIAYLTRYEFTKQLRKKLLSKSNSYYIRPTGLDQSNVAIGGIMP